MSPLKALSAELLRYTSVRDAATELARELAARLDIPVALLSRRGESWRYEGEGFPRAAGVTPPLAGALTVPSGVSPTAGDGWTGIVLGRFHSRDWVLMVPGAPRAWADCEWLDPLGELTEVTLQNVADHEEMIEATQRARRAYAFTRRLSGVTEAGRVHRMIVDTMAAQVGATCGALAIYNPQERHLAIVSTHGYPRAIVEDLRIIPGAGILGQAFTTGRPLIGRASDEASGRRRLRYATDSYVVVPLKSAQAVIGLVALTDRADHQPFDDQDLADLRLLAPAAALALGQVHLHQNIDELTQMATVDVVTGLFNRRYFEARLDVEVQRVRRQGQDLSLLMVDIDDFKRVNDSLGHLAGDEVLRAVGGVLRNTVRIFDLCARYGGEEFLILMPGATAAVAAGVAERVRRQIKLHCSRGSVTVSASIGVGVLTPGDTGEQLIATADAGLMAAKAAGKDTIRFGRQSEPIARSFDRRGEAHDSPARS